MKGDGSQIFRSCDRTRENKDGRREDERCSGLADTRVCQGHSEVLRIGELLLLIYSGLCIHSQTTT